MADAYITRRGGGGKSSGTYVWKKLTAQAGGFVDFVVSDSKTAYPDGAVHTDGYWYEKFDSSTLISENIREGVNIWGVIGTLVEGKSGIDFGEVTLASDASSISIQHNLGTIPSKAYLLPSSFGFAKGTIMAMNDASFYVYGDYPYSVQAGFSAKTATNAKVTWQRAVDASYADWKAGTYTWITIA